MLYISDQNEKCYRSMKGDYGMSASNYMHCIMWSKNVTSSSLSQRNAGKCTKEEIHGNLYL